MGQLFSAYLNRMISDLDKPKYIKYQYKSCYLGNINNKKEINFVKSIFCYFDFGV